MEEQHGLNKPVIGLVHGAWADRSSWSTMIRSLQDGYMVGVPALRLLSLTDDSAATRKCISDLAMPVLVVGHSYGGAIITEAASDLTNVHEFMDVAAYAPNQGEGLRA